MKALFIGAGSIGKRHIRDFYKECTKHGINPEIHALRRKTGNLEDIEPFVSEQITEMTDKDYDVIFITNPTNLHYDALLKCKGRGRFYFIEKPIFDNKRVFLKELDITDQNSYIAAPMRHTKLYKRLKGIVDNQKTFSARVIASSYLPEWRSGVDYRLNYSARKEMGGGVNLDLIHEIDYVYDLFGEPCQSFCFSGKFSDLEISSDDLSAYILKYEKLICEIHLDYFGRKTKRSCELYTHEGIYVADFVEEKLIYPDGAVADCHVINNEEFINEMAYFYEFISGKVRSINPPSLAMKTLDIALGRERNHE